MPILRGMVHGLLLSAAVTAQRAETFELSDLISNLERFTGPQPLVLRNLCDLMSRAFEAEPKMRVVLGRVDDSHQRPFTVVGNAEQIKFVRCLLDQLRRADLQELRVQCTQVTMPLPVAVAAGLVAGKVVEVDEGKAGKVLKDAVAAKGTLRNLPEAGILPLQPSVMIKPCREAAAGAAAEPFTRSEVRVEALPLSEKEAWFSLQWRGEPVQSTVSRKAPQFETGMRLEPGSGAMVMSPQGEQAVVLWVRFVFTRNAVPAYQQDSQGKGKESGK